MQKSKNVESFQTIRGVKPTLQGNLYSRQIFSGHLTATKTVSHWPNLFHCTVCRFQPSPDNRQYFFFKFSVYTKQPGQHIDGFAYVTLIKPHKATVEAIYTGMMRLYTLLTTSCRLKFFWRQSCKSRMKPPSQPGMYTIEIGYSNIRLKRKFNG